MTCPSCTRALQVAAHRDYRNGCMGCGARKLAHMPQEERERMFDRIQFESGWDMRCEVVQMVRDELVRMRKLRGESARKERA